MPALIGAVALAACLAQAPPPPSPPAPPPTTVENPFTHVVSNLGDDLKALPSLDNAGILTAGGIFALVFKNNNDARLHTWVLEQNSDSSAASLGNVLGHGATQGAAAIGVWLAGRGAGNARVESTGASLIRAQILNGLLTQGLKFAVDRTRPDGGAYSFPSGHTSAAFATAAVLQHDYGVAAALPAYALGGFIGWSRVRSNHHWLSDVAFGAAIGLVSGRAASRHASPLAAA